MFNETESLIEQKNIEEYARRLTDKYTSTAYYLESEHTHSMLQVSGCNQNF